MQPDITTISVPVIKPGEIKSLLTERMKRSHPSFRFLASATGVYHFQRLKEFQDYHLKEAVHFVFSLSDNSINVSISSRLNSVHTFTPVYNNGFINPHVDLKAIIKGEGIFPSPTTVYQFDGTVDGLAQVLDEAIGDVTAAGIPYFDTRLDNLRSNALVKAGMAITDAWEFDKTLLRNELNVQLRKARLIATNLRHPVYADLKQKLNGVQGQSPEAYKEIPRLAFELMELYCNSRIIS